MTASQVFNLSRLDSFGSLSRFDSLSRFGSLSRFDSLPRNCGLSRFSSNSSFAFANNNNAMSNSFFSNALLGGGAAQNFGGAEEGSWLCGLRGETPVYFAGDLVADKETYEETVKEETEKQEVEKKEGPQPSSGQGVSDDLSRLAKGMAIHYHVKKVARRRGGEADGGNMLSGFEPEPEALTALLKMVAEGHVDLDSSAQCAQLNMSVLLDPNGSWARRKDATHKALTALGLKGRTGNRKKEEVNSVRIFSALLQEILSCLDKNMSDEATIKRGLSVNQ